MMIVDNEWCFIHIPKTSGKNFKKAVFNTYKKSFKHYDNENVSEIEKLYWEGYNQEFLTSLGINFDSRIVDPNAPQHSSVSMWEQVGIYDKNKHKIFTIVRNPYTRLISLYYNVVRMCSYNHIIIPSLEDILFSFDLDFIFGFSNLKRTQVEYLKNKNGDIVCERFYKMELDQEKIQNDFQLRGINDVKYSTADYNKNYSEIYTDKMIDYVQTTFKQDFEYFEYDSKPFW